MVSESQDPVAAIEAALIAMRRDQQRGRLHRRGTGGEGPAPWGDGPPPWTRGGPHPGHHGPHDRSLGGAARFRMLDALLSASQGGAGEARMGISEIADAISVDQPRASRLVNESAERGLVTRRADERDARRSVVELTDAGRALLESARATRRTAVTDAVAGFTPEETATFAALLTRFVQAWPR
jgi:DNA-binding MarR family transcriptional regulator